MKNWTYRLIPAAVGLVLGIAPVTVLADFESGWEAYQNGDFATAISAWSPLAEAGDARAQYNIGTLYD